MGLYFYNLDLLGDKVMENLNRFYLKDLISHGTPVHRFFKIVYLLFFSMRVMFSKM